MDCFGAALGIHRIARSIGKETYIVLNGYNSTMDDLVKDAKETEEYEFVNSDKALTLADENALAVVVDTHRPTLVESLALLEKINRTVIIDHHRRTEGALPNTLLSYMESYASSASELVSEIVQYACDKKVLSKFEADALLAAGCHRDGQRKTQSGPWGHKAQAGHEGFRRDRAGQRYLRGTAQGGRCHHRKETGSQGSGVPARVQAGSGQRAGHIFQKHLIN